MITVLLLFMEYMTRPHNILKIILFLTSFLFSFFLPSFLCFIFPSRPSSKPTQSLITRIIDIGAFHNFVRFPHSDLIRYSQNFFYFPIAFMVVLRFILPLSATECIIWKTRYFHTFHIFFQWCWYPCISLLKFPSYSLCLMLDFVWLFNLVNTSICINVYLHYVQFVISSCLKSTFVCHHYVLRLQ